MTPCPAPVPAVVEGMLKGMMLLRPEDPKAWVEEYLSGYPQSYSMVNRAVAAKGCPTAADRKWAEESGAAAIATAYLKEEADDDDDDDDEDNYPYHTCKVAAVRKHNHDTYVLEVETNRLSCPNLSYHFNLSVSGKSRPYTPVAYDASSGKATFVVKRVEGGTVSPLVCKLKAGDTVDVQGPLKGEFRLQDYLARTAGPKELLLVGGGSGLTPLLQLAEGVKGTDVRVHLVYGNKTEEDILCRGQIREAGFASVTHCLSRGDVPARPAPGEVFLEGRISAAALSRVLPAVHPGCRAVICGTMTFNIEMKKLCKGLGFEPSQIVLC